MKRWPHEGGGGVGPGDGGRRQACRAATVPWMCLALLAFAPQIEEVLALEAEGSAKHAELTAELKERQKKLDDLMESFAVS